MKQVMYVKKVDKAHGTNLSYLGHTVYYGFIHQE